MEEGGREPEQQEESSPSRCTTLVWNSSQAAASLVGTGS